MRQARQSGQDEAMGTACVARMFQAYGDSQKWWFDDGYEVVNMNSHEITGKGRKKTGQQDMLLKSAWRTFCNFLIYSG